MANGNGATTRLRSATHAASLKCGRIAAASGRRFGFEPHARRWRRCQARGQRWWALGMRNRTVSTRHCCRV